MTAGAPAITSTPEVTEKTEEEVTFKDMSQYYPNSLL